MLYCSSPSASTRNQNYLCLGIPKGWMEGCIECIPRATLSQQADTVAFWSGLKDMVTADHSGCGIWGWRRRCGSCSKTWGEGSAHQRLLVRCGRMDLLLWHCCWRHLSYAQRTPSAAHGCAMSSRAEAQSFHPGIISWMPLAQGRTASSCKAARGDARGCSTYKVCICFPWAELPKTCSGECRLDATGAAPIQAARRPCLVPTIPVRQDRGGVHRPGCCHQDPRSRGRAVTSCTSHNLQLLLGSLSMACVLTVGRLPYSWTWSKLPLPGHQQYLSGFLYFDHLCDRGCALHTCQQMQMAFCREIMKVRPLKLELLHQTACTV